MAKEDKGIRESDVGLPKAAVEAEVVVRKESGKIEKVKMKVPPVNELVFRKGDKFELADLPFEVKEVKGAELTLKRQDIK